MAKLVATAILDLALNQIKNNSNRMVVCSAQPTVYADLTTLKLAESAMVAGDYTLANGDTSGRKLTTGAKNGLTITANGNATHIGLGNSVATTLDLVTTCTTQALNTGGTVDVPGWKYEIQNPT
jgi:hypothetical protein